MSKQHQPTTNVAGFEHKQGGPGMKLVVVVAFIAFVGGGIITMAVTGPSKGISEATQPPVSAALPTQTAETTDPLKQRRPLTDFLSAQEVENLRRSIEEGQTQGSLPLGGGSAGAGSIPTTNNPNVPNPEPWQYDPIADKHYDPRPGHQHWHQGKPPSQTGGSAAAVPSITNPKPWEYDPATNKFWHPGHQHWHNGQPPPPDQRDQ